MISQTRMTIFINAKFKKSDDQTNIDKYRVAANITEYNIVSKLIFLIINITKFIKNYFMSKMDTGVYSESKTF